MMAYQIGGNRGALEMSTDTESFCAETCRTHGRRCG